MAWPETFTVTVIGQVNFLGQERLIKWISNTALTTYTCVFPFYISFYSV